MIIGRLKHVWKHQGPLGLLQAIVRRATTPRSRLSAVCVRIVRDAAGLEIGGPSSIFARGGLISVYPLARRLDNCNFSMETIFGNSATPSTWNKDAEPSERSHRQSASIARLGREYICEGSNLVDIPSESYEFVLSSHMIEHCANPLRALAEWRRVLKDNGSVILVIPHKDGTFDHRRPTTTLQHLVKDFEEKVTESDLTHVPEVLELHDLERDPGAINGETFKDRVNRNFAIRGVHHHVFDTRLAVDMVVEAGFAVLDIDLLKPYHIVVVAQKRLEGDANTGFNPPNINEVLRSSPFPSDRLK